MTEAKSNRKVCRGRIFPQIQWTQEQKAQWKAERQVFKERWQPIFAQVQQSLIKTHYNATIISQFPEAKIKLKLLWSHH